MPASTVGQRPARRGRRHRSEPRRLGAGRPAADVGGSEDGDWRRSALDLERSRAWRLERRHARPSECTRSRRSRASGGGAATASGTVGASERAGRRPLAVGVGRSEAGVGVARVGEARRPVWRSHADAASGGAARDCEWGNGEAV
jgi:hypothetical protein